MIYKILFGTIVGIFLMTLFSYITAEITENQFKEPVLLKKLIAQSSIEINLSVTSLKFIGWILHFAMGLFFLVAYYFLWQYTFLEPTYLHGALMGFVSGFVGIAVWELIFFLHSNPPQVNLREHFIHLMIAHVIFGVGAVAGYTIV